MKQERLNGLATISLENDILEKIKYEDVIEHYSIEVKKIW